MNLRTCVDPTGRFVYGIHKPHFFVENMREHDHISSLGIFDDGQNHENLANFPTGPVNVESADRIYEIPNAFPFKGVTYISESWAIPKSENPDSIFLPESPKTSFSNVIKKWFKDPDISSAKIQELYQNLPAPVLLTLAKTSTDKIDLSCMAHMACKFVLDPKTEKPCGLEYEKDKTGKIRPVIYNHDLFEVLANNIYLADDFRQAMVLRPGVQGESEIMGEWMVQAEDGPSHVFEYLRQNSYIPWGHYAANMANDAVRYRVNDLKPSDMEGMRHLYYQRTYLQMARLVGVKIPDRRRTLTVDELENLRIKILSGLVSEKTVSEKKVKFSKTLWGWNYGFDFSPTGYRLHASHQQIHQQFAMIPASIPAKGFKNRELPCFGCGDMIADFIRDYREKTGKIFFDVYIEAILNNERTDGRTDKDSSLIVYKDDRVMAFVPKAQTSQWEIQLMPLSPVGNILETDLITRKSLDTAMLACVRTLGLMGAEMITSIEYSKPVEDKDTGQRLLYAFLPKLPISPGGFSEAQLRWINGHFPEDFALACRKKMS
ncbi:hypothetical protein QUF76_05880 [Desulfobacterales bacterium HSG16]|nr:hypothetical protein [Desulfobacterales bacterium HSG16]